MASAKSKKTAVKRRTTKSVTRRPKRTTKRVSLLEPHQLKGIYIYNAVLSFIYAVLAVLILIIIDANYVTLGSSYLTQDTLLSREGALVYSHGFEPLFTLDLRWLMVGVLGLVATMQLLAITRYRTRYEQCLSKGCSKLIWLIAGGPAGVMLVVLATYTGIRDIGSLVIVALGATLSASLLHVAERSFVSDGHASKMLMATSVLAGVLPWVVIEQQKVSTILYGSGVPLFPLIIFSKVVLIGVGLVLLNSIMRYTRLSWGSNFLAVSWVYILATTLLFLVAPLVFLLGA